MALVVNVVVSLLNAAHELISTMMKCSTCLFVMTRVSTEARWRMVSLHLDAGWSYNRISDHFGVAKSTVRDQIQRYLETRNMADRPRSGRPRVLDEDESRLCVSMAESRVFRDPAVDPRKTENNLHQCLEINHFSSPPLCCSLQLSSPDEVPKTY